MEEFTAHYDPELIERKWQDYWNECNIYKWDPDQPRSNTFVIDTPPPTVSGTLHMGHIFSYTQTDFIARYQRMSGKTVYYTMAFDDNGLPTERLVEKLRNIRAISTSRKEFISVCQEVVKDEEEKFRLLFKSIALSVDWSQEYQTISDHSRKISQMSFLDLFSKNKVYRQEQPSLWDCVDQTALAQVDIIEQEFASIMSDIIFFVDKSAELITISTTRPELIPAAVAVFYHPDDVRYKHLAGRHAVTPLFDNRVPIIADSLVDMTKGTGLVMCSTFGDWTDVAWWRKHCLPLKIIITPWGKIDYLDVSNNYAKQLVGLNIKAARTKILDLLKENKHILSQKDIVHKVKCAERSGAPIEILVTNQWLIRILDQKDQLLAKANQCNWHPSHMKNKLDQWINGLAWDWCISRQRFFGVPFPVWYSKRAGEEGKIIVPDPKDLPIDPTIDLPMGYDRSEVDADTDVMDTWATSSVSVQINSHGIADGFMLDKSRHEKLFPADLRPQAHEIIRSWAFYTIVKAHLHQNTIPWHNLMISGWCLAEDKTKMAKSKGNIISPVGIIKEYGADIVRYWASTAKLGTDIIYSTHTMKIGRKLITKLWNAAKFVAQIIESINESATVAELVENRTILETMDLWLLSKLTNLIDTVTKEFDSFEYYNARTAIEDFFWHDFCDNYLELVKGRIYNKNDRGYISGINTLYHALNTILRLFAPFVPHITEEIYQKVFKPSNSIHDPGTWPKTNNYFYGQIFISIGDSAINILNAVRKAKADKNMSMKTIIPILKIAPGRADSDISSLATVLKDLGNVINAQQIILADTLKDNCYQTTDGLFMVTIC